MKLTLLHESKIHALKGHFGILVVAPSDGCPVDSTLLSLDASLAIPTHVLHFKVSQHTRIPSPSAEPLVLALWLNQGTRRFVVNHRKPHGLGVASTQSYS
jgi:hypothetical protein